MNAGTHRKPKPLLRQTLLLISLICIVSATRVRAGHALAPSLGLMHIKSTDGDKYTLLSPGLNYTADFRIKKLHFIISTTPVFQLWSRENGKGYTNPQFYNFYMGNDLFIGLARDYELQGRFRLSPAAGYHQNGILMRGKSRYLDFYSLTSGLGLHVLATDYGKPRLFNYAFLSLGLDIFDYLYEENKLSTGLSLCIGAGHRF